MRALPRSWDAVLLLAFIPGAAWWAFIVLIQPTGLGSHANIYTGAAAAWLSGGDPWTFGPPSAVFAGPPPMLLPFVPFVSLPVDVTRLVWASLDLVVAAWVIRRLGMPAYWLAFPPLFSAIVLGHIEVLILGLIVLRGPIGGLAMLIKPYVVLPLLAERRWTAVVLAGVVGLVTLPFLPWPRFVAEFGEISATLGRQNTGDSTFGQPLLMAIGVVALAALGPRRALWFAVPVLWPYAQPIYKVASIPLMSPLLALIWSIPVPGATLVGIVVLATLTLVERRRPLPRWLATGLRPVSRAFDPQPEPISGRPVTTISAGAPV